MSSRGGNAKTAARTRSAASTRPERATPTRPLNVGFLADHPVMQEKITAADMREYRELKAKRADYEREADTFDRMAARYDTRHEKDSAEIANFFRMMSHAAKSQLNIMGQYEAKRARMSAARKAARAAADAKKAAGMTGYRKSKASVAPGTALAWAQAHPDEVETEQISRSADVGLEMLARERGYDVTPHLATRSQLDRLVNDLGAHEFYRGFSSRINRTGQAGTPEEIQTAAARAKGYANDFLKGAYHGSPGTFGSGYYVGYGDGAKVLAHEYAGAGHTGGVVMRGAFIPGAKIAGISETKLAMEREGNDFLRAHGVTPTRKPSGDVTSGQMFGARDAAKLSGAARGEYELHFGDVGRYATWKGYDALGGQNYRYWIILNRGAVIGQRALAKPSRRIIERGE